MSKQPPPAASAVGPCPTKIQVSRTPRHWKFTQNNQPGGGRVVRRCWVNFRCRGVLLIWITVGQGPIVLAVGAGGGCLDIFSLIYHFCSFSLFLGWLVGCFGLNGPLRQYFSLYRAVSQREGEREEKE